jgi:hypothetical protein
MAATDDLKELKKVEPEDVPEPGAMTHEDAGVEPEDEQEADQDLSMDY